MLCAPWHLTGACAGLTLNSFTNPMTTQLTQTKLNKLTIFDLYKHYAALESSFPLLCPESQELVKAELEQCVALRSEKIDRLYYAWAHHEDAVQRAKQEQDLLTDQRKYHENQINQIKRLIKWLRRAVTTDETSIKGNDYQFAFSKLSNLSVEIRSDINEWTQKERLEFCVVETVTTTKHSVVSSIDGKVLEESTKPVTKSEIIPNLNAIRDAYKEGKQLPLGVKVSQDYSIRRKRLLTKKQITSSVDIVGEAASEYSSEFLSKLDSTGND